MGRIITQTMRECDIVARWGGEEFVIALPETSFEDALVAAERLRAAVEATAIPIEGDDEIHVTVSIGVAGRDNGDPLARVLERADQAMYAAKVAGPQSRAWGW